MIGWYVLAGFIVATVVAVVILQIMWNPRD
jgi:hypothetical protein